VQAAIIHDHFCDDKHQIKPWRVTHRMFYLAMRAGGTEEDQARLMYYAVYAFGPRWDKLKPSANCGPNCIQRVTGERVWVYRPAEQARDGPARELEEVKGRIAEARKEGKTVTLDELERIADSKRPLDPFLVAVETDR
jgi:hypothetical protein